MAQATSTSESSSGRLIEAIAKGIPNLLAAVTREQKP